MLASLETMMRHRLACAVLPALFLAMAAPAQAQQEGADPLDPILACRTIEEATRRLECFDTAAAALGNQVRSGRIVAVEREEIEAVERDTFGLDLPSLPNLSMALFRAQANAAVDGESPVGAGEADAGAEHNGLRVLERTEEGRAELVSMTIDRVEEFGYQRLRFYMTNGQVWEQTSTMRVRVPRRGVTEAEIRRTRMGAHLMKINGVGRNIEVRRIR